MGALFNFKGLDIMKEMTTTFKGETQQPIGAIPRGGVVTIGFYPDKQVLYLRYNKKTEITLVYERVEGFRLEKLVKTSKDNTSDVAGKFLATGALGAAGKLVSGVLVGREKHETNWVGTLSYVDKDGAAQELYFIHVVNGNIPYTGDVPEPSASKFERLVNEIACRSGAALTEL